MKETHTTRKGAGALVFHVTAHCFPCPCVPQKGTPRVCSGPLGHGMWERAGWEAPPRSARAHKAALLQAAAQLGDPCSLSVTLIADDSTRDVQSANYFASGFLPTACAGAPVHVCNTTETQAIGSDSSCVTIDGHAIATTCSSKTCSSEKKVT